MLSKFPVSAVLRLFFVLIVLGPGLASAATGPIKVGIIGLDAHAVGWTRMINGPGANPSLSSLRIVAAYPAFSPDVPYSADNIQQNTAKMREMGAEICDSIEAMVEKVDAVMLLSIDGRPHLDQARPVFKSRKPLYIDKPVAASLTDVVQIFREARESGTPCFSNSSLRYAPDIARAKADPKVGRVLGCDAYSSSKTTIPGHPDLFYYGIHGCEILFSVMGPGCQTVSRVKTASTDLATGVWADGRLGSFRGIREGSQGFGATIFGEKGITAIGRLNGFEVLLAEIATFFKTGQPPMTVEHTLEIYAFMEAADESQRQGGRPVSLQSVLAKAQQAADKRFKR